MIGHGTDWQTQIRVECYARASSTESAHEPADELLLLAHAAIVVNPTLDGLAMAVDPPRLGWDEADEDQAVAVAIAQYTVMHRTASQSLGA